MRNLVPGGSKMRPGRGRPLSLFPFCTGRLVFDTIDSVHNKTKREIIELIHVLSRSAVVHGLDVTTHADT